MFNKLVSTRAFSSSHSKVAVIGAGCGGQSVIAQLARTGKISANEITVYDPREQHHYQPSYTMVAGGVFGDAKTTKAQYESQVVVKENQSLLANTPGVNWVKESVQSFDPENNGLTLSDGSKVTYDYLVVNPGLSLRFDKVQGAQEALDDKESPVGTMYTLEGAYKASVLRESFRGGNAIFTCPPFPIKCGGAPQKMLHLSEATFRKNGVRDQTNMMFYTATPVLFPPSDDFNGALLDNCLVKGIKPIFKHDLTAIDKDNRVATFKNAATGESVQQDYDFLHIVPHQSAPAFIATSPLAHDNGYLDVDINTLQHKRFSNVFGLGDVANLPTSKTAAAIFSQTPVVVQNLLREMGEEKAQAKYDGYAACPVFMGDNKLMMCEFKYGRANDTTFFADQTKPSRFFFHLKKDIFPAVYWDLMPKGQWFGAKNWFHKPSF